jgi:rod shape-determining protein MreC
LDLEAKNTALLKENALLKSKLGTTLKKNPLKDTTYSRLVADDSVKQTIHYTYMPARVLNNSVDKKNNFITLHLGAKDGVKKNMIVIGSKGIVGKVIQVTENFSLAASVLSTEFNVSSVTPNGTLSKVSWEELRNPYHAVLSGIPESEKLKKGDSILTSGFSKFPPNIMIGRVLSKLQGSKSGGGRYKILLSTNFKKLDFVYIVQDEVDLERKELEETVESNENQVE